MSTKKYYFLQKIIDYLENKNKKFSNFFDRFKDLPIPT